MMALFNKKGASYLSLDMPASPTKTNFIFSENGVTTDYGVFPKEKVGKYTTVSPTAMNEDIEITFNKRVLNKKR